MMPEILRVIGVLPLIVLCCLQEAQAGKVLEHHRYERSVGAEISIMDWQRLGDPPGRIRTQIDSETDLTEMNPGLATVAWHVKDERRETDLRIRRHRDRLHLKGTFRGEKIDRWREIDEAPWFQTLSISFRPFLNSDAKAIEFWTVRSDTLGVHKLVAKKNGIEELNIDGRGVAAEKLELRLTGIGSLFWKAHYWFRKNDGLFLSFVGPQGVPGRPGIVVKLID